MFRILTFIDEGPSHKAKTFLSLDLSFVRFELETNF